MRNLWLLAAIFVLLTVAMQADMYALRHNTWWYTPPLPHRHRWELYSIQGLYSQRSCPGQHVETMQIDDHVYFLGCYGDTTHD